jgi:hypothetical protein
MAAPTEDPDARGRQRRLLIIVSVFALILVAATVFTRIRTRSVDTASDRGTTELRAAWRPVDLAALERAYSAATFAANTTGDLGAVDRLLPGVRHPRLRQLTFGRSDVVRAEYSVPAWAGDACLDIIVRGPAPNHVTVTRRARC